jgi:uncharacterized membrane protein
MLSFNYVERNKQKLSGLSLVTTLSTSSVELLIYIESHFSPLLPRKQSLTPSIKNKQKNRCPLPETPLQLREEV